MPGAKAALLEVSDFIVLGVRSREFARCVEPDESFNSAVQSRLRVTGGRRSGDSPVNGVGVKDYERAYVCLTRIRMHGLPFTRTVPYHPAL